MRVGWTTPMRPPNQEATAPSTGAKKPNSAPRDTTLRVSSAARLACSLALSAACRYCCTKGTTLRKPAAGRLASAIEAA